MSTEKCPHCGKPLVLDIKKAVLDKVKPVANPKTDLAGGVIKAVADAVETKLEDGLGFLKKFNQSAGASTFGNPTADLMGGYSNSTRELMRRREALIKNGGAVNTGDPETDKGSRAASMLNKMLFSGLNKGENK